MYLMLHKVVDASQQRGAWYTVACSLLMRLMLRCVLDASQQKGMGGACAHWLQLAHVIHALQQRRIGVEHGKVAWTFLTHIHVALQRS